MGSGTRLFVSYSHDDDEWLERVRVHLKPLVRDGLIDPWDDTRIRAGDQWHSEIVRALAEARAAILLVSPNFYASDYIAEKELPPLLWKAEADGTRILILVIDHCRYQRDSALSRFQAIHDPAEPLNSLAETEQNRILDTLAVEIERLFGRAALATADADPKNENAPNPYQPRKPVVPPLFVGRRDQLRDLGLALDRGESVSLVGGWRIGKSSLLATWALEAKRRGRAVRELSGEGPEGAGIAAFVAALTGAVAPDGPDDAANVLDA